MKKNLWRNTSGNNLNLLNNFYVQPWVTPVAWLPHVKLWQAAYGWHVVFWNDLGRREIHQFFSN